MGHRFSYVRYLLDHAPGNDYVLLTSVGARSTTEFREQLAARELETLELLVDRTPDGDVLAEAVAALCADRRFDHVVLLDADHPLKTWWRAGRRAFSRLDASPTVSFLLTRYPQRLSPAEPTALLRRMAMATLVAMARLNGTLVRAVALAARGSTRRGLIVHRAPDPAECRATATDRARLREEHGVPGARLVVGIFGVISMDKNLDVVAEALRTLDGDLLLAGTLYDDAAAWLESCPADVRARVLTRDGYLSERQFDELIALSDVVAVTMSYDRPSAIMGKALAAGVPVVSAGSPLRARELRLTGAGRAAELDPRGIADAISALVSGAPIDQRAVAGASPRVLVEALLGTDPGPPAARDA